MNKKIEVLNPFPYGYDALTGEKVICDISHMPGIADMSFWKNESKCEPMSFICSLSRALIENNTKLLVQQCNGEKHLCLKYEYKDRKGMNLIHTVDFGTIGDEVEELELLIHVLQYIKEEVEKHKPSRTFRCGHCGREYQSTRLRTVAGKFVCDECMQTVCPICSEHKVEFVFTDKGTYSRICKECYEKSPDGYVLCDECDDKPFCKGKPVKYKDLYNDSGKLSCKQAADDKSRLKHCIFCNSYVKEDDFFGGCICSNCLGVKEPLSEES